MSENMPESEKYEGTPEVENTVDSLGSKDALEDIAALSDDDGILRFDRLDVDLWQGRIARLLIFFALCIQPLFVFPAGRMTFYFDLTTFKFAFFAIYMIILLVAIAIVWISRMLRTPRMLPKGKLSIADWAVLGFAAVTILSSLFSPYKDEANLWVGRPDRHDGAITQLLYVAVFFIASRWYKPRKSDFKLFGISATIIALLGIFQFFGWDILDYLLSDRGDQVIIVHDQLSTLGNTNFVSTYASVVALLFGFLYVKASSKWRFLYLTASALCIWMMFISNADSGLVGILAALLFALLYVIESRQVFGRLLILGSFWLIAYILRTFLLGIVHGSRPVTDLLPLAAAALVFLAAGMFLAWFRRQTHRIDFERPVRWKLGLVLIASCILLGLAGVEVLGRYSDSGIIYEAREILHGNIHDDFGTQRIFVWRNGFQAFLENPILGNGPDTFRNSFPIEGQAEGIVRFATYYDKAHNEYLQILTCQGILGLLCYMLFLGGVFIKSVSRAFRNPLMMAIIIAVFGYLAQAFFNISLPVASQILWVFLGMLMNERVQNLKWVIKTKDTHETSDVSPALLCDEAEEAQSHG